MTDAMFNGRVGVIIEVAPNRFYQYVLKEVEADVRLARESEPISAGEVLSPYLRGPMIVTMNLRGRLVSRDEAERPAWVPPEPPAEIETRRALEQR